MERFDTIVVGAGKAGLAAGYYLKRRGVRFVIFDADARVGDVWRRRWDSLRLFTTARYSALPGMRMPIPPSSHATKDQVADYLEGYAERFALPVRSRVRVDRLERIDGRFVVTAGERRFEADSVIVATGAHHDPRVPAFARELSPAIRQMHSKDYRNPSQLQDGAVLVVGTGNSGADIALELVEDRRVFLSGPEPRHIPVDIDRWFARHVAFHVVRFAGIHVLTFRTPIGRRAIGRRRTHGDPLVRVKPKWLKAAGVERVPRALGAIDGRPLLEDGSTPDVANVIWCTGFRQDLSWIRLPIFDGEGEVRHQRGLACDEPGLAFVGLPFQFAVASDALPGMNRDARHVVRHLETAHPEGYADEVSSLAAEPWGAQGQVTT